MNRIDVNKKEQPVIIKGVVNVVKGNLGILVGFLAICVIVSFSSEYFLTWTNIFNVLRQASAAIMCACAMTMILISGGIDLSVGAVVAFASCFTAGLITNNGFAVPLAVLAGLGIGVVAGAINGFIISRTPLPPFMVTYSIQSIFTGLAYLYTNAQTIRVADEKFISIGTGSIGKIPYPVIYMIIVVILVSTILNRTKFGRNLYAMGGNPKAAEYAGINMKRIKVMIYIFSGLMAAFSGIIVASRSYTGNPTAGQGYEMDAIAAVVLGGAGMSGGVGRVSGTVIGALIMAVLNNGMNLTGINTFWQYVVKGVVILLAIYVDFIREKKKMSIKKSE